MTLNYHGLELNYIKKGKGDKVMLLFHGYSQDANVFENFTDILISEYTFYIFDLPFHGASKFDQSVDFDRDFWMKVMIRFVSRVSTRLSLIGTPIPRLSQTKPTLKL